MAHECSALDALGGELLNPCLEVSFGFGAKPLLILRDAKNAIGVGRERRLNRDHVNQANFCGRSLRWLARLQDSLFRALTESSWTSDPLKLKHRSRTQWIRCFYLLVVAGASR
jgi:hypothetical protein